MLTSITGKNFEKAQTDQAANIYAESFPPEERLSIPALIGYLRRPPKGFNMLAVKESSDGPVQGIIGQWALEHSVKSEVGELSSPQAVLFLEHLAVSETARSGGIGSEAMREWLDMLREQHDPSSIVVLECDPPGTDKWSERRIGFYKRLGFEPLNTEYVQPPYEEGLPSVPLLLLARRLEDNSSSPITAEETEQVKQTLLKEVYGQEL